MATNVFNSVKKATYIGSIIGIIVALIIVFIAIYLFTKKDTVWAESLILLGGLIGGISTYYYKKASKSTMELLEEKIPGEPQEESKTGSDEDFDENIDELDYVEDSDEEEENPNEEQETSDEVRIINDILDTLIASSDEERKKDKIKELKRTIVDMNLENIIDTLMVNIDLLKEAYEKASSDDKKIVQDSLNLFDSIDIKKFKNAFLK